MPRRWLALLPWLVLIPLGLAGRAMQAAPDAAFTVNNTADLNDDNVGDSLCATAAGLCTLRAAVQEASANSNADTISLPAGIYTLTLVGLDDSGLSGDLDITGTVTLLGAGAASTIINGNSGATGDRVLQVLTGTVTIAGVTIKNGNAAGDSGGGGIYNGVFATLTLSNTTVTGNSATGTLPWGGGIFNNGKLVLTHSTISTNTVAGSASPSGAGIFDIGFYLNLSDTVVSGNTTLGMGGGLFTWGTAITLTNSTVSGNHAAGGGGIYNLSPSLRLVNSTVSANLATQAGGGIYNEIGSTSLYNVTVTDNWANSEGDGNYTGGGVANGAAGTLNLLNSLIAGNFRTGSSVSFPVVLDSDCDGTVTSLGANFVGVTDAPCTISSFVPITGVALLGPLANNGGSTPTHALLAGSPAIDAGALLGCTDALGAPITRDQRGAPRPAYGGASLRCDLGAYEWQNVVLLPLIRR